MKPIRIFILVLLAVLLPIRGAVAATMLCPEGEGPVSAAVVVEHVHHGMQPSHEMHAGHMPAQHHASDGPAHQDPPSGEHPASCHFCASGCCMASMVGMLPFVGQPRLVSRVDFPVLTARVPAFQSGGQDRPPRTI